jgi:hypothetical protein
VSILISAALEGVLEGSVPSKFEITIPARVLVLHSETTPLLSPSKALIIPLSQKTPAETGTPSAMCKVRCLCKNFSIFIFNNSLNEIIKTLPLIN